MRNRLWLTAVVVLSGAVGAVFGSGVLAHKRRPIYALDSYTSVAQRPASIQYSGDGNVIVENVRWSSWGGQRARGSGTLHLITSCDPDCAQAPVAMVPVQVLAQQITVCPNGRRVYDETSTVLPAASRRVLNRSSYALTLRRCAP